MAKIGKNRELAAVRLLLHYWFRWINQNNFYRQIRNFILDMRNMPNTVEDGPIVAGQVSPIQILYSIN
jgi:hypothetical protein